MSNLFISDGTTTIYFAGTDAGRFKYTEFVPGVARAKGGGVWQESPVSDGRRLLSMYYDNIFDEIKFHVKPLPTDTDQDDVEADVNELLDMVRAANMYWASASGTPVHIGHQGKGETNTRYALIHFAEIPELRDINSIEWEQLHMLDLQLFIEHGHWQAQVPGSGTAVAISSGEDFNTIAHGWQTPTTEEIVHVANHHRIANISHIYRYDDSAGTYSSNLVSSTAFDLFPNPVALNDALRICSTAIADEGGVLNLIFDLLDAASGNMSISWQFYNGSSWSGMSPTGDASALQNTGISEVSLRPDAATWATGTFNSVTGFWIQAIVTQVGSGNVPTQQNRIVTSAVMPKIDIAASQVAGQLPSLFNMDFIGGGWNRMLVCRRLTSRGSNFTPYINLRATGNDQNQTGISVAVGSGAFAQEDTTEWINSVVGGSIGTDSTDADSSDFANVAKVTIDNTEAQSYNGYFRMALTGRATADPASTLFGRVRIKVAGDARSYIFPLNTNETDLGGSNDDVYLWNVGTVFIDTASVSAAATTRIEIFIDATHENGVGVHFYSAILMPVDEWSMEIALPLDQIGTDFTTPSTFPDDVGAGERAIASSILDPRRGQASAEIIDTNGDMVQRAVVRATTPGALEPGVAQSLYFLWWKTLIDEAGEIAYDTYNPFSICLVTVDKCERFLGSRGAA